MTFGKTDRLMGTDRRDKIFILAEDAERLGLDDGAKVKVRCDTGEMLGIVQLAPLNLVHSKRAGRRPTF